ncbi:putative pancreatic secretory proteinase inhibitor [Anableps anableps]
MTGKVFVLGLLLICVAADAAEKSGLLKEPSCSDNENIMGCPRIYEPVCGSDGNTYENQCLLCIKRQETKTDIRIVKMGRC